MNNLTGNLDQFIQDNYILEGFKARMQVLITEREGMISENTLSVCEGGFPTYGDTCFQELGKKMEKLISEFSV